MNKVALGLGGGSLIQVSNRTLTQMMSYLIDTSDGKCIMIDGGDYCKEDAENLYEMLSSRGKKVDLWIMTHAHRDHLGALTWLLENKEDFDIEIEHLCFHFPDNEWLTGRDYWEINEKFLELTKEKKIAVITPHAGDVFTIGDVSVEVISVPEDYKNYTINATSMIIVVHFPKQDVLFLGDFDENGEAEFLKKHDPASIRKDIVQMSHHGQNGVTYDFYKLIKPKICLYTAPLWLWENNLYRCTDPETAGKGPFAIFETRRWMEELGAEQSYTLADGDILFY